MNNNLINEKSNITLIDNDISHDEVNALSEVNVDAIKDLIYTIRGKQIMIDRDLAMLYKVETKRLNEQVKRNIERFPTHFRFQLNDEETSELVAKCDRFKTLKHSSANPYCFTESGIAMLSSVLKSDIAIKVSIRIITIFVELRKFLVNNQELFSRLSNLELKQLENEQKFEKVFDYIAENKEVSQKMFFDGQIYDAYSLLTNIVKKANKNIILIDNYVDTITLDILSKKHSNVTIQIYTSKNTKLTKTDTDKFNEQYKNLTVSYINTFHDRFLILDKNICFHIGASIKDAGNKSFAINKIEDKQIIADILVRLNN
ncbi:ORF6N domain-containing protein [Mycoplasma sp. OR1901]|nr:ORF6N domain-containing protein [Mycoplasma sp. OR1901]